MPRREPPKSQPKNIVKPVAGAGISNKLKLSYFIASIVPIIVMTYLYLDYITPEAEKRGNSSIPK